MNRPAVSPLVVSLICAALAAPVAHAESWTLYCPQLFDSVQARVLGPHLIEIEGDRISALSAADKIPAAAVRAEGVCSPGWIDLHTHLTTDPSGQGFTEPYRLNPTDIAYRAHANGVLTLRAGFTTVRDLGDNWGVTVSLRNAVNSGIMSGPRIFTSGKSIATTGGHADPSNGTSMRFMGDPGPAQGVVNSPSDARKAVRQRYKEGSDLIKITATGGVLSIAKNGLNPQFEQAELDAIVKTAKDYGLTVAAHAHGIEGMKRAVLAGVISIEHGTFMNDEVMALMRERGTYYVPTLMAGAWVAAKAEVPGFYVPMVAAKARYIGPQISKTLSKAYAAGVSIAFGTDAGVYPHGRNGEEFALLVKAGVPLLKALQMATLSAAKVIQQEQTLGTIAPNYYADIVVFPASAMNDASELSRVLMVVKGGQIVSAK